MRKGFPQWDDVDCGAIFSRLAAVVKTVPKLVPADSRDIILVAPHVVVQATEKWAEPN